MLRVLRPRNVASGEQKSASPIVQAVCTPHERGCCDETSCDSSNFSEIRSWFGATGTQHPGAHAASAAPRCELRAGRPLRSTGLVS